MARARALPAYFYHIDKKGNPSRAVGFFFGLVIALLICGNLMEKADIIGKYFGDEVIEFYGFLTILVS
jgi:hypothetical protein